MSTVPKSTCYHCYAMPYDKCAVIMLIDGPERFFITWVDSTLPKNRFMKTSAVMNEVSVREELSRMGKSEVQIDRLIIEARNGVK